MEFSLGGVSADCLLWPGDNVGIPAKRTCADVVTKAREPIAEFAGSFAKCIEKLFIHFSVAILIASGQVTCGPD